MPAHKDVECDETVLGPFVQADVRLGQDGECRQSVAFTKRMRDGAEEGHAARSCDVGQERSRLSLFKLSVRVADIDDRVLSESLHGAGWRSWSRARHVIQPSCSDRAGPSLRNLDTRRRGGQISHLLSTTIAIPRSTYIKPMRITCQRLGAT